MFERFTDRARQVVIIAQNEARDMGSPAITGQHLLLALHDEQEGIAAVVLKDAKFDPLAYRMRISEEITTDSAPSHLPFTVASKKILEKSLGEALQLGHNYIGTEHILLGMIREYPELIDWMFAQELRQMVITKLSSYGPNTRDPSPVDELKERLKRYVAPVLLGEVVKVVMEWHESEKP